MPICGSPGLSRAMRPGLPKVPVPLGGILNGGYEYEFYSYARLGDTIRCRSRYKDIVQKTSKAGPMVLVVIEDEGHGGEKIIAAMTEAYARFAAAMAKEHPAAGKPRPPTAWPSPPPTVVPNPRQGGLHPAGVAAVCADCSQTVDPATLAAVEEAQRDAALAEERGERLPLLRPLRRRPDRAGTPPRRWSRAGRRRPTPGRSRAGRSFQTSRSAELQNCQERLEDLRGNIAVACMEGDRPFP